MRNAKRAAPRTVVALAAMATLLLAPNAYAGDGADEAGVTTEDTTGGTDESDDGTTGRTAEGEDGGSERPMEPAVNDQAGATATAVAPPPYEEAPAEDLSTSPSWTMEATATTYWIKCNIAATNPHYSNGPDGVIAKLVVKSCSGNHYATMETYGWFYRYPPGEVGESGPRATSYGVTEVYPGMSRTAFWVPEEGNPGLYCNMKHWYQASWTVNLYMVGSPTSDQKTPLSKMVHPQRCS